MGAQSKVLIPVGLIGLAIAALTFWRIGLVAGIGVLVVAALAVVALGQRAAADRDDDDLLAGYGFVDRPDGIGDLTTVDEPLLPWTPMPEPVETTEPVPTTEPVETTEPVATTEPGPTTEVAETAWAEPAEPAEPGAAPAAWDDGSTWTSASVTDDRNPLDDLVGLDDVDVIAEVERIEAGGAAPTDDTSLADVVPFERHMVNEAVSSPDDILAASHATELSAEGPTDNSELARLLAKVQARLAAYE